MSEAKKNRKTTRFLKISQIKFMNKQQIHLYIKKLHSIVLSQEIHLKKFRTKIHNRSYVASQHVTKQIQCVDVSTQTEVSTQHIPAKEPSLERNEQVSNYLNDIKQAATEGWLKQMGMVYEPTSGLYYQSSSGYYYDPTYNLYYDGNTGTYLKYNEESFEYEFYSKVETVPTTSNAKNVKENVKNVKIDANETDESMDDHGKNDVKKKQRRKSHSPENHRRRYRSYSQSSSSNSDRSWKRRNRKNNRKRHERLRRSRSKSNTSSKEDGECSISESSDSDKEKMSKEKPERFRSKKDIAARYPPSLRLIIQETDLKEKLKIGSLFIIPYTGGTLGREGSHDVIIPDINVSKNHLKFIFNKDKNRYECCDEGSRNGTVLNGKRMSESNMKSKKMHLMHDSIIQLNKTKVLCHIHQGMTTCSKCEPGLIQPTKEEPKPAVVEVLSHKDALKQLKKQYGLEKEKYKETDDSNSSSNTTVTYKNRAETRRKTVGSSHHNEKTVASSVDTSISSENKGFKMLSKLGWSAGQSLGKSEHGLLEPINITSNEGTKGLGSETTIPSINFAPKSKRKAEILLKTRERFENSGQPNIPTVNLDEESSETDT